jgi:outer membrane protein TolC
MEPVDRATRARDRASLRAARGLVAGLLCLVTPWARADVPAAAEVEVLTLEAAVTRALGRNPAVSIVAEEIHRAEALVTQARAGALPSLAFNASYLRLDHDRVLNGRVISAANQVAASLSATLPLIAPQRWVQWSRSRDNLEVARMSAQEARRQLAITVARTYLALVAQHRVIEVAERARRTAEAHLSFARQRFSAGYGNRLDEVRAAQELATTAAQLQAAIGQLARLREALGVLVSSDGPVDASDALTLPALPTLEEALREGTSRRSDVLLGQVRIAAAEHAVRTGWADYAPALTANAQAFFQDPPTLTVPILGWQVFVGLTVPLYDGGLRYGQARERRIFAHQARLALDGGQRQIEGDVRAAWESLEHAEAARQEAREAARLAGEGLKLANLAYQAGATGNLEVIDAERRARDAETAAVVVEDAARQAQLDLLIASGRFAF